LLVLILLLLLSTGHGFANSLVLQFSVCVVPNNKNSWKWTVNPLDVMREAISAVHGVTAYAAISSVSKRLAFWIQLADGFGWDTMRNVFIEYERDNLAGKTMPKNVQEEKDQWLLRYSNETGHDLTAFMKHTWKLEVSTAAINEVSSWNLPTWMPAMVSSTKVHSRGGSIVPP
jgi:hypothetical protein